MNSESPAGDTAVAEGDREEAALRRWHPAECWYYPLLARLVVLLSNFVTRGMALLSGSASAGRRRHPPRKAGLGPESLGEPPYAYEVVMVGGGVAADCSLASAVSLTCGPMAAPAALPRS